MRDALPAPPRRPILIAAIGNRFMSDDGVACAVVEALRRDLNPSVRFVHADNVLSLIDEWPAHELVVVIDAVQSGAPPGTIHEVDAIARSLPLTSCASSHGIELAHVVEMARALDRLPQRLIVVGIEGARFDRGAALSPEAEAAVPRAADAVRRILDARRTP